MSAIVNAFLAGACFTPAVNAYLAGDMRTALAALAFAVANLVAAALYVRGA